MDWPVLRWGDGPARALIVHGLSSSKEGWWRVGPALADMGYAVTAPDLRGHGSAPKDRPLTIARHADDLLALGDHWDLVLGHSLGGAATLAATTRRPGWTARLVLEDPALVVPDPEFARAELLSDFDHPLDRANQERLNPTWHPVDCGHKAEALAASGPEAVEATIADNPDWNVVAEAIGLDVPTLIVGADPEEGTIVPPSLGRSIADANPLVDAVWIDGATHSIHRDRFDELMAVVRGWLAGA